MTVKKGEDLQMIGSVCRNIYFVKSGLLRIHYIKNGNSITESFEFENSIVARSDSLFDAKPSQKGIQAIEDTELVAIYSTKLFQLYDLDPDIERLFRIIFERAYVKTVERIESLQFHSAEERYTNLLEHSQPIIKRIPLNYIASYLGITPVSLSRIRSKIQLANNH
ncbi:MAG: Crp/Fnr family transcriptional regulator [Flavobacteriaceae bacterium]|nr:Crp/Fnr family transcriptional regulator [Flavobacteriaceae bacterium]